MTDEPRWVDANAIAGLLQEAFGTDITTAPRVCQSCRVTSVVAAHRVYQGAGLVLRCPACEDVAARIVRLPDHLVVLLAGQWRLELPLPGDSGLSSDRR